MPAIAASNLATMGATLFRSLKHGTTTVSSMAGAAADDAGWVIPAL
jgi:hypothetical protein